MTTFTLVVVSTADGFIARAPGHSPADWASPEEQALFLALVDGADWAVMGRGTHEAADRPDRRRVIFSRTSRPPEWRRPTQVWVDPRDLGPEDLAAVVGHVRPMREALILGGTAVHDWFLERGRIDAAIVTVEPVRFGSGLPIFSSWTGAPEKVMRAAAFREAGARVVNDRGTRVVQFHRPATGTGPAAPDGSAAAS